MFEDVVDINDYFHAYPLLMMEQARRTKHFLKTKEGLLMDIQEMSDKQLTDTIEMLKKRLP